MLLLPDLITKLFVSSSTHTEGVNHMSLPTQFKDLATDKRISCAGILVGKVSYYERLAQRIFSSCERFRGASARCKPRLNVERSASTERSHNCSIGRRMENVATSIPSDSTSLRTNVSRGRAYWLVRIGAYTSQGCGR